MTELEQIIQGQINEAGPMTLAEYMLICLSHPQYGYYMNRDPLGAVGDFVTAPEISQMFGELLGLAVAQNWLDQGAPRPFHLVELGPGRGTLMADILRATQSVPGFNTALVLHFIETSPALRARQTKTVNHPIRHHDTVATLPTDAPLYLLANEFFDALPIRQFQRNGEAWRERLVGLNADGALQFGHSDLMRPEALDARLHTTFDGDIVETSQAAQNIATFLIQRIAAQGGFALIIDYGNWQSLGDTFQALRGHQPVSPLEAPGSADLTAHVDFEALALAAPDLLSSDLTPQGVFLERLGITARAQALAQNLNGPALDQHIAAHRRLTHGDEMGTLFKVMALYPKGAAPPPGFAE